MRLARLNIDPGKISWRRVMDTSDRMLREITIGRRGTEERGREGQRAHDGLRHHRRVGAHGGPRRHHRVATVPALKTHGGVDARAVKKENVDALRAGIANLQRHIEKVAKVGVPSVIVVNRFPWDTPTELGLVRALCGEVRGAVDVVLGGHWARGGAGVLDAVTALAKCPPSRFVPLYPDSMAPADKIACIATSIYRADGIALGDVAKATLADDEARGHGGFTVCMAKTQYSFNHDAKLLGALTGFTRRLPHCATRTQRARGRELVSESER